MDERLEEKIDELRSSLRRAEHSYYVSLKYTRTVDVIRNLIERTISTYSLGADVLLVWLVIEGKISDIPENIIEKITILKQHIEDEEFQKSFEVMLFLRRVMRAQFTKEEEFRRHVTMRVKLDGQEHQFHIDNLQEYYNDLVQFVTKTMKHVHGVRDES